MEETMYLKKGGSTTEKFKHKRQHKPYIGHDSALGKHKLDPPPTSFTARA